MDISNLLYLFLYLLLIAFFSGIEIAFISLNRISIEFKKKQGSHSASIIARYFTKPDEFITSSLIGLNIVLILFSVTLQNFLSPLWSNSNFNYNSYPIFIFIIELLLSTSIIFLFGEFFPKALFKSKNNSVLILLAPFIYIFFLILKPITNFFIAIAEYTIVHILKIKTDITHSQHFKYVDLEYFIAEKTLYDKKQDTIQNKLLRNALQFPKTPVKDCLIPKTDIVAININDSIEDALEKFVSQKLSRIIVYKNNLDNIIGYIHHLDLFKNPRSIKSILIPIPFYAETTKVNHVLTNLSQQGKSLGWVIDEYGLTAGIISIEKLLEEVFGKNGINEEHFTDNNLIEKKITKNSYLFSGRLEIDYLNEAYQLTLPKNDVETLSGFLISLFGEIPEKNEIIDFENYTFRVDKVNDKTIEIIEININNL